MTSLVDSAGRGFGVLEVLECKWWSTSERMLNIIVNINMRSIDIQEDAEALTKYLDFVP
jgi:hypothetical protein